MATVLMTTNKGNITVELDEAKAPKTVANFIDYVKKGHYTNTIFHRVIKDFMIQGGGFEPNMHQKPADQTVENEAKNGLKNDKYTIAMARTSAPHSAGAQFFINTVDNRQLDYRGDATAAMAGFCVFGRVVEGMDVVDRIRVVPTGPKAPLAADVPVTPILVESAKALDE